MKNIILALVVVIALTGAVFWFFGRDDAYRAEKILYRTNKTYDKILLNPDATPPSMVQKTVSDLERVVEEHPETEAARLARMKLVEIYMTSKKYAAALLLFDDIVAAEETKSRERATRALYMKGIAYEKMGNWVMALNVFEKLREEFPDTMIGLQVPLYIANHYRLNQETAKAQEAFGEAEEFYNNTYEANEGTTRGFIALSMLLELYGKFRLYEKAGETIKRIIVAYPMDTAYAHVLPFIDTIYMKRLNEPNRALDMYEIIGEKTGDEKLKRFIHGKISELKEE